MVFAALRDDWNAMDETNSFFDPFEDPDPGCSEPGNKPMKSNATKAQGTPAAQRPRLGDYLERGEFTPLDALEGQEVLIHSLEPITTKFGEAFKTGITDEVGEIHTCCLGQCLIYPALLQVAEQIKAGVIDFPVSARFVKSGRTWTCE